MIVKEIRLVKQDWYETDTTKTGWASDGWEFIDSGASAVYNKWTIIEHIRTDKHDNPTIGIAEKETEI